MKNFNVSIISAVAIMAIGMTTTAFGQSPIQYPRGHALNCPPALGNQYENFPRGVKESSAAGTKACLDTIEARADAIRKFAHAGEALAATIANEKSSVLDVIKAKFEYLEASTNFSTADRPMHTLNLAATMKYFDWVIERGKTNLALDMVGLQVFDNWQKSVFAIEHHPGLDKGLLEQARLAQDVRAARESAEFKNILRTMDEMLKLDREGMKLLEPRMNLVCADNSKPADDLCADGSEPAAKQKKK
jgi:hypothetical protein